MTNDFQVMDINKKTDLLSNQCECPSCGDKYPKGVPYVTVRCNTCEIDYRTDFKQNIYDKIARKIEQTLAKRNGITFKIAEDYYRTGLHIQANYLDMKCWNVSDLKEEDDIIRFCWNCGQCQNCFTCNRGHIFSDSKKICPKCSSKDIRKTYFKEPLKHNNLPYLKICPHCKSKKIELTRTNQKTKCHLCKSSKLSEPKKRALYTLTIERKKGYQI